MHLVSGNISLDCMLLLSQDSEPQMTSGFISFVGASRSAFLFITLRQFMVITRRFYCGRLNADELVLELVDFTLLEEREELLDPHVGFSDMCWSVGTASKEWVEGWRE